jgi:hypothetical protein
LLEQGAELQTQTVHWMCDWYVEVFVDVMQGLDAQPFVLVLVLEPKPDAQLYVEGEPTCSNNRIGGRIKEGRRTECGVEFELSNRSRVRCNEVEPPTRSQDKRVSSVSQMASDPDDCRVSHEPMSDEAVSKNDSSLPNQLLKDFDVFDARDLVLGDV